MESWKKNKYARIEIPEEDANRIRDALRIALKTGRVKLTDDQKRLLAKLHNCLGETEEVTHAGKTGW
jgi:hypothetical protein